MIDLTRNTGSWRIDPVIVCVCGVSIHDNNSARSGHEERWHYPEYPASYSEPVLYY